jgi:release factor glutamine methyltransferase
VTARTQAAAERGRRRAYSLLQRHQRELVRPVRVALLDREWDVLPGSFSPAYTPITELLSTWVPYPVGGSFLEVGSGAGVTAVMAALAGCRRVTALDISETAVRNTRLNAERHGVADRVRVLRSDLFDGLGPDERFDTIYWNSNFVEAPADFVPETELHHALFDPSYRTHARYVAEGPGRLTPGGRLLLGFTDLGSRDVLDDLCAAAGLQVEVLRAASRTVEITIEYQLLELRPTGRHGRRDSR